MTKQKRRSAPVAASTLVDALLDYEQMAAVLNVTPRQLRDWVYSGIVPHLRLGHRTVRFEPSRVIASLRRREVREVA